MLAGTRQRVGVLLGLMLVLAGNLSCSGGSTGAAPTEAIERVPLSARQERQQVVQGSGEVPEVLAVGERPTDAERAEVAELMTRFRARHDTFDLSLLEAYVTTHPFSPYTPSLYFLLGLSARDMARYQETLSFLEAAWTRFRAARTPMARAQADRVVAELAVMYAQLGRRETLQTMFRALAMRPPLGAAAERLNHA